MIWFQKIIDKLRDILVLTTIKKVDVNSSDLVSIQRHILLEKPTLRKVFEEFYGLCRKLDTTLLSGAGKVIEIGAGVSFLKNVFPDVISTDIKNCAHLDMVVDAQNMPFANASVRSVYGINCFHHFPNPEKFFAELDRVLVNGGGCVLIEPYYGFLAGLFYRNIFKLEHFNKKQLDWHTTGANVMVGANQALSYVVFLRDEIRFNELFVRLRVIHTSPINNYVRYVLSGGLNFRQITPDFFDPILKILEFLLLPVRRFLALHHVIVIRKAEAPKR